MSPPRRFFFYLLAVLVAIFICLRHAAAEDMPSAAAEQTTPAAAEQPTPDVQPEAMAPEEAALPANTQEIQPATEQPTELPVEQSPQLPERLVQLGICEVVARAVSSNLDIAVERYVPDIRDAEVMSAKGEFDPLLSIDYSYSDSEVPQTSREGIATGAAETETKMNDLSGTLSGKLISGTEYELVFNRQYSQFIRKGVFDEGTGRFITQKDPWQYLLDTYVNVTQPLLKDFGLTANLASIRIARVQRDVSLEDFRQGVINTVADALRAYWNLVLALENLRVTENSLVLAQDLLRQNRIRLKVGVMSPLEVTEAEAGVAQREEGVIISRRLVKDAEDNLKRLLNLPQNTEEWNVTIVPVDKPITVRQEFDANQQIQIALENRPDYKSALMRVKSDAINIQFARNQTLPTVDLIGQYEFQAVDMDVDTALDDIGSGKSPSWIAGLSAEYPIGNHTAKGNYQSAQLQNMQSEVSAENVRLGIIVAVRDAIRGVETSLKSIEASQKTVEFAQQSLDAEQKKLEVGISTSYDVLQFMDQLIGAQRREVIAKVGYRTSLIDVAAATGTLLEKYNVVINENF
jgi:outer membrane protein TolC